MTFDEWWATRKAPRVECAVVAREVWDAAVAAETERCAQAVKGTPTVMHYGDDWGCPDGEAMIAEAERRIREGAP